MLPLNFTITYQRFQAKDSSTSKPSYAALNLDSFAAGIFSMVSKGSLSGKTSFASVHPSFIDEIYLNRLSNEKNITLLTPKNVIEVSKKAAAWRAPDSLKSVDGSPVSPETGHELIIVQVEIKATAGDFSLSQIRLICSKNENDSAAVNAYPLGYLQDKEHIKRKKLGEKIELQSKNKKINFVFNVPGTYIPRFVVFKQNNIAKVPTIVSADEAPNVSSF